MTEHHPDDADKYRIMNFDPGCGVCVEDYADSYAQAVRRVNERRESWPHELFWLEFPKNLEGKIATIGDL